MVKGNITYTRNLLLALALLTILPLWSQEHATERKKVAVVLSGGGAKGMAHIGVLKVIERAGLPIDIITGTSMGSLVGGLYAIGYNADRLDSLVRIQDWSYVITDREDLRLQSLEDRRKQNTYVIQRGLSLGKNSQRDGGLISGKNLAVLFQKLCTGYIDSMDFQKLPIPFACVATDIVTNTEHDFFSGRLPQAMRASMAIPAVFSPVRIGKEVLVDGGMRNNYPADLARQMGADFIIGVTVQEKPKTAQDLTSTMSIIGQIIDVNTMNKYNDNLAITDIPIRVNPGKFGTASFNNAAVDSLIQMGEQEAMRHWNELIALRDSLNLPTDYAPRRLSPLHPSAMTERVKIIGVDFEKMTPQDQRFLNQKFHLQHLDSIDTQGEERIKTSMRVDLFYQDADVRMVPDGDAFRLILTADNRKTSQVGVGSRFDNEEMVALILNADFPLHTAMPTNVDLTLRLGKRLMGRAELTLHPTSLTRPILAYTMRHNDIEMYHNGERDYSLIYNHHQAEVMPLNLNVRNFNVRMGLRWDYLHFNDKLISEHSTLNQFDNAHYFSYRAEIDFNSEDDWYFPTRGARFKAAYAYLTDNFSQLDDKAGMSDVSALWRKSFRLSSRFTLQPLFYGRLIFGTEPPPLFRNVIGGQWFGHYLEQQMPFAGQSHFCEAERHFVAAQIQGQQRVGTSHFVLLRAAAGQQASDISKILDHKTLIGIEGAYYYRTMFGPLGATIGYSNISKNISFYINLGYEF